ncbi:MAG: PHP domain-containing protein [Christensenellales bacterium]|jgi:putative hydrolase
MRLTADYHTHTLHSHGKGSVQDNVEAAIKRGLVTVGIADHSISHYAYGVKKGRLGEYIAYIENAKRVYSDRIRIQTGIELNLTGLDGSIDLPKGYDFDTMILGYHKTAICKDFKTAWTFFTGSRFGRALEITRAYMLAIQKWHIDIVAHPGYGVPVDYQLLAKACADYGTLFEINNKHTDLTAEDLQLAALTGVKFVVSSDAHTPQEVGFAPQAIALAERAGLTSRQIVNVTED